MKTILTLFILFCCSVISFAQVTPLNLPEAFDNSVTLPRNALDGFNMFTDNTFTSFKPEYANKLAAIKDYAKKVNDYMVQTAQEIQTLAMNNDPIIQDTSMEEVNRRIKALNEEMTTIITNGVGELGTAQAEINETINSLPGNNEKLTALNNYISGKYADILNRYSAVLREKLVSINQIYQDVNYGSAIRNPVIRVTTLASLYSTVEAFVNHRNDIVKGTAERLARDYMAYKN